MAKIKVEVFIDLKDEDYNEENPKTAKEVADHMVVYSDDVVDGVVLACRFKGIDNTNDFYLGNASIGKVTVIDED